MDLKNLISTTISETGNNITRPLRKAFDSVGDIFSVTDKNPSKKIKQIKGILSLLGAVLWANGEIKEKEVFEIRKYLYGNFNEEEVDKLTEVIKTKKDINIQEAVANLAEITTPEKRTLINVLLEISHADGDYSEAEKKVIKDICAEFGFGEDIITEIDEEYLIRQKKRENIFKSSAGIIIALFVIAIFILTATFLKSVLFGLILAYFFIPLESWFENKFFKNPIIIAIGNVIMTIISPFLSLKKSITGLLIRKKTGSIADLSPPDPDKKAKISLINRSCYATVLSIIIGFLGIIFFVGWISASYVKGVGSSIKHWADRTVAAERAEKNDSKTGIINKKKIQEKIANRVNKGTEETGKKALVKKEKSYLESLFAGGVKKVESFKPKLEKLPGFAWIKNKVAEYLNNENNRDALIGMLLDKTGGIFSYTAGFVGNMAGFLLNIVLTVFFFSFFLQKIALFNSRNKEKTTVGVYVIEAIFKSRWMPFMSRDALEDARVILDNIIFKLKTWVRSYLSIIIIESVFYISVFFILGVPYCLLVGLIAGCTILLPFIGPVASCILTIAVCLAVNPHTSMLLILLIILVYLFMNGVVEQLFIYPALVGETLGLNTLETIIVVLLGGLFAGIPGMIFAVPVTSILKYLIPKIYNCWR